MSAQTTRSPVIITSSDEQWDNGLGYLYELELFDEGHELDELSCDYGVLYIPLEVGAWQLGYYPLQAIDYRCASVSGLLLTDAGVGQTGYQFLEISGSTSLCQGLEEAEQIIREHLALRVQSRVPLGKKTK